MGVSTAFRVVRSMSCVSAEATELRAHVWLRWETGDDATDTSVAVTGKWGRPPANAAEALNDPTRSEEKRYRVDTFRLALVADKEGVTGHAQQ